MAEENPYAKYRDQVQPVPVQSLRPIIGSVTPQEEARNTAQDAREAERLRLEQERAERDRIEFERKQAKEAAAIPRDIADVRAELSGVIDKAKRAKELSRTSWFATGFGAETMGGMGGTAARDVQGLLDTIGGNIAFDRLSRMRAESPTGGALGNVTERELALLQSTVASLDKTQSDEQFQRAMDDVIASYQRILDKLPAPEGQAGETPTSLQQQQQSPLTQSNPFRAAGEGEAFLTSEQRDLLARFTAAYDSGATLEELRAIGQTPFATQAELDEARRQGRRPTMTPQGRDPRADMGLVESIGETITGSERSTAETEALPDWSASPELNNLSAAGLKAGVGSFFASPDEAIAVIKAQYPETQVRIDQKGNYIFRSSIDGKEYAIKPGFRASDIPRAAGLVAAFSPAGVARTAGGAFLANAGTQAAIEASQAATGGEFNSSDVLLAGAGGVAGQQVARGISAVRTAAPARRSSVIPDAEEVITTGRQEGVPVMTSDVRPPQTWVGNWLQGTGEKIPFVGTGGKRATQQQSRIAMIEKLADDYATDGATIDDVTRDFMKTRGADIAKYSQQKKEVFSSLAGSPPPAVQNTLDALDKAIGRLGQFETHRGLVSRLSGWRNDLARSRSIDDVEMMRKAIGDTFADESLSASSTALREVVNGPDGLYSAIKGDMAKHIGDNGGEQAVAKWSAANAKLADFADELENGTVARVLRNGEATPEEAASLLFSKRPSEVEALFRNLSPEGQTRARALVVEKLIDDAGGIEEISTAKFRAALRRARKTFGVTFSDAEAQRFTGMARLLQATRRAEQAGVATPTGQAAIPFAAAGAGGGIGTGLLSGDALLGGLFAGGTLTSFRVYESRAMRNLLVALSKTEPGSRAERNILANIAKVSTPAAASASTRVQPNSPEQPAAAKIEVR